MFNTHTFGSNDPAEVAGTFPNSCFPCESSALYLHLGVYVLYTEIWDRNRCQGALMTLPGLVLNGFISFTASFCAVHKDSAGDVLKQMIYHSLL